MTNVTQPKPGQTCTNCGKTDLYAIRFDGKTQLFRMGPPSQGIVLRVHVCTAKAVEMYHRKNPHGTVASRTDYGWRVLLRAREGSGSKNPVWRYFTTLELLQEAITGKRPTGRNYVQGTEVVEIQYAKWTTHNPELKVEPEAETASKKVTTKKSPRSVRTGK